MDSRWLKGYEGNAKEDRRKEVLSYSKAFAELKTLLSEHFAKKPSDRNYDEGWFHRQIHINEYNQALDDVMKLMNIDNN